MSAILQNSSLRKDLIFYSNLDEWNGARDMISGTVGTPTAVYPVLDKKGNGRRWLEYNGTSSYTALANDVRYSFVNAMTWIYKVKYYSLSNAPALSSKLGGGNYEHNFYVNTDGSISLFLFNGSIAAGYSEYLSPAGTILVNTDYTISVNLSGTSITLIVNGVTVSTTKSNVNGGFTAGINTSCDLIIGKRGTAYNSCIYYMFRIFNYALSAQQIINYSKPEYPIEAIDRGATGVVLTSGTITTGKKYLIKLFVAGDSFTNVGGTNATGNIFTATGTTPTTWTNSSQLVALGAILDLNAEGMSSATWVDKTTGQTATNSGTFFNLPAASNLGAMYFNGAAKVAYTGMAALDGIVSFAAEITPLTLAGRIFDNSKLLIYVNASGYLTVSRDGTTLINSGAASIAINTTYKIVVTSTAAGVTNVYINNALSGTANQAAGTPASGTTWNIGNNAASNQPFTGVIKAVPIETRIITLDEIAFLNAI